TGPLSSSQREIHSPLRIRLPPPSHSQMDHAHMLYRPGGNLPVLHGRNRPAPRSPSPTFALHRPSLPHPRRHHHAHLHRGVPLLRHQSLARLSQHHPPHLKPRSYQTRLTSRREDQCSLLISPFLGF